MFGKNDIVGKKYFKDAAGKLLVTSVFMTLQGEGPFRGQPAVFVRLAMCNLACSFCDTYFNSGDWYTPEELFEKINLVVGEYLKDAPRPNQGKSPPSLEWWECWSGVEGVETPRKMGLVITGGEPMLQDALGPFLEAIGPYFEWTQIESNGTQYQPLPTTTVLVVSPKCAEKNGKATKYLQPNTKVLERANCLKFVMSGDVDSPYSSVPAWALEWREQTDLPIFVSPMNIYNREPQASKILRAGQNDITIDQRSKIDEVISFWEPGLLNMEANQRNHEYTAKYCIQNGLVFNMQLHLFASLA